MAGASNLTEELVRLVQLLVLEGSKVVEGFAAAHGLHHTDVEALSRLMIAQDRGAPMTAGALARELGLTSGAITFVVDRLQRAGHVIRVRDDLDRRKVLLHYSPSGRALASEFFAPRGRHIDAVMEQFTTEELETVRRYLIATGSALTAHRMTMTRSTQTPLDASESAR